MCYPASSHHPPPTLSLVFLHIEKVGEKVLHCPVFSPNNDVTLAIILFIVFIVATMATIFTIKTENQNTALNSLAERQCDSLNMVSKQSSYLVCNMAWRQLHILYK